MEDLPEVNSAFDFSAKDEGNPLFIADAGPLECQNKGCSSDFLKAPIRQCMSGHVFCVNCHQGHITCLLCPKKLFPAPAIDDILNVIMDFCPNRSRGCEVKIHFNERTHHLETFCEYEHLFCPMHNCSLQFKLRDDFATHMTRFHKDNVDYISFGAPMHFAFDKHSETRILLEKETRVVFVIYYVVAQTATVLYFFGINFCDGNKYTYKLINQRSKANLDPNDSHDTPVPVTTFKGGYGRLKSRQLLHEWRTGKILKCRFVIKMVTSTASSQV